MNFIEELKWRGMIHDITPGTEEKLLEKSASGYAGFDPTASSLHIGHMIPIMLLVHFQRAGHKPVALVGGATGMIGDPSGKSEERKLLSAETVAYNQDCIKKQLSKFLDFSGDSAAEIVNNHDWFGTMGFLDFLRDVGKFLTVNYMVSKDSVKSRWEQGISYTEFSYQLLQSFDFYWLYTNKNCILQMGGSDQWGNITSGTELIRRKASGEAFALTCPLLTRADGKKFGKTEGGESVWLDPQRTSPYKFLQYWLNTTDADAPKLLRLFTLLSKEKIELLEKEHATAPEERIMQKALAKDITIRVHSEADYQAAVEASEILFGKGTTESLHKLSEGDFLSLFEGVPQASVSRAEFDSGISVLDLVSDKTKMFSSKGEARRMFQQGGVSLNKTKVTDPAEKVTADELLNSRYLLFQRGKKNYFVVRVE
ncbi:MAG TPA: tyrosine--tRNA ligase [Chitinispirillaceae bacterium]|nr:tyrosine--tRNA ligase [Chitinispirillaceae bacterium]